MGEQVVDNTSDSFKPDYLPRGSAQAQLQPSLPMTTATSGQRTVTMKADVIAGILVATHVMPSRKACQVQCTTCTSWIGTAEGNIGLLLVHKIVPNFLDFYLMVN